MVREAHTTLFSRIGVRGGNRPSDSSDGATGGACSRFSRTHNRGIRNALSDSLAVIAPPRTTARGSAVSFIFWRNRPRSPLFGDRPLPIRQFSQFSVKRRRSGAKHLAVVPGYRLADNLPLRHTLHLHQKAANNRGPRSVSCDSRCRQYARPVGLAAGCQERVVADVGSWCWSEDSQPSSSSWLDSTQSPSIDKFSDLYRRRGSTSGIQRWSKGCSPKRGECSA